MKNVNETNNTSTPLTGLDMILQRKSVRKYTDRKVTGEQLENLVKAGMAAPSGL
ncbi:MAG: hypothetical protein GY737_32225 [Desulfobacteraceae bacterium]|nr:hypothetical protein [Desulfobacteraceae bacterium]